MCSRHFGVRSGIKERERERKIKNHFWYIKIQNQRTSGSRFYKKKTSKNQRVSWNNLQLCKRLFDQFLDLMITASYRCIYQTRFSGSWEPWLYHQCRLILIILSRTVVSIPLGNRPENRLLSGSLSLNCALTLVSSLFF